MSSSETDSWLTIRTELSRSGHKPLFPKQEGVIMTRIHIGPGLGTNQGNLGAKMFSGSTAISHGVNNHDGLGDGLAKIDMNINDANTVGSSAAPATS